MAENTTMAEIFTAGETVRLKSGGPLMTVKTVEGTTVYAGWFEGNKYKEGRFQAIMLTHDDGGPVIA